MTDLREALNHWKCAGCGGSGKYQQDAKGRARAEARGKIPDPKFQPDPVTCKVCNGDGLNPIASAALREPLGDARDELLALADAGLRHAEGLSAQLERPDWKPSRAHIEQSRNSIKRLAEALRPAPVLQCEAEPVALSDAQLRDTAEAAKAAAARVIEDARLDPEALRKPYAAPARCDAEAEFYDPQRHFVRPPRPPPSEAGREAIARAIYLAMYESRGGRWEANETKGVWHDIADKFCAILRASPDPGTVAVASTEAG